MSKGLRNVLSVLSVVVLIGGLFYGCSSTPPTGLPETDNSSLQRTLLVADATAVSKLVDVLSAPDSLLVNNVAGSHKFKVPKNGLNAAVVISIKIGREVVLGKDAIVFEFGPDGLVFDKAATLEFDLGDLNAAAKSVSLYYYDPSLAGWVYQGTADAVDGKASFNIYHFSKYAIE